MSTKVMNNAHKRAKTKTRTIAQIGMLSAIAVVLMLFKLPLPFAPSFYELDISEVPVLIGCFTMGPVAGAVIELIKILLNLLINGTKTAGIGELANFLIGCSFVVPAGIIYGRVKSKKGALIGMGIGTVCMTVLGCIVNAFVLLPVYAKVMELPLDALVQLGSKVNASITDLTSFVVFAVGPFNLLKGIVVSLVVLLIYKKISPIFKMNYM